MMNALEIAKRDFDRADHAVGDALIRVRNAGLVPTVQKTSDSGREYTTEADAWVDFYYGRSAKNAERFVRELPAAAQPMLAEIEALRLATETKKQALAAEKARKAFVRAKRAAIAEEREANPHRPLASVNPVAAENYDILVTVFGDLRAEYAKRMLANAIRATAGRVVQNVNEKATLEAAEASFCGYLAKLAGKIDSRILSGRLQGVLWDGSWLTVETEAGRQVWRTQCIINFSVYGKAFNQWPTRRIS